MPSEGGPGSAWVAAASVVRRLDALPSSACAARTYAGLFCGSFCATLAAHWLVRRAAARLPAILGRNRLSAADREDWDSRVVSTLMSVIMLCGYAKHAAPAGLLDAWRTDAFDAVCVGSCGRDVWMTALCGYLSADALLCARALLAKRRNAGPPARAGAYDDPVLLLHHAVVGVAFGVGMYSRLATSYMAALIVNEASTPFVNLRALINYAVPPRQQRGAVKVLYVANGVVLVFSFGFARVVWTFAICLHICTAWATLWRAGVLAGGARLPVVVSLSILCAAHYAINLVWFRHIVQHVAKQLRQDPETKAI